MSGGSYDYLCFKLDDAVGTLRERHSDNAAVLALAEHIERLARVMQAIEWADSCDTDWNGNDDKIRELLGTSAILDVAIRQAHKARATLVREIMRAEKARGV